jgi:hypothetical protein
MKTAKEWIASVKDPVIKRYLEENVLKELIDIVKDNFESFVLGTFDWEGTPQHLDFWFEVSKSDPSTLSYSDFKHLDKSVETQTLDHRIGLTCICGGGPSGRTVDVHGNRICDSCGYYSHIPSFPTVVVETQLKEDKETPKMDKLQHPTAFRKEWMKNNAHVVNTEHHELLLMKAYALYYHEHKTKSVEQPKVSVNEDAVAFAEWVTFNCKWDDDYKVYSCDLKEGAFNIDELYQNYLEDKHK